MNDNHLSAWEQEEYLLDQSTPRMLRHLAECAQCRAAVGQLEHSVGIYRQAAIEWSAGSLATRPQQVLTPIRQPTISMGWAMAAIIPIVLLLISWLPFHLSNRRPPQSAAPISDDALLDQVDEQLSVAVPSSMESLTHLVSSGSSDAGKGTHLVKTN